MKLKLLALAAMLAVAALVMVLAAGGGQARTAAGPAPWPLLSHVTHLATTGNPPSQADCNAAGRRCFNPTSIANSYDYAALHAAGTDGSGETIAIIDSFGASTIRQDLGVFNTTFGLPHLCGETGPSDPSANCPASVSPRFDIVCFHGCPPPVPPPPNDGTGLEYHNGWDLEVALDVEWAHATAPGANIMLVTTPTAETLGQQGFQQMMNAEQWVIDNHKADVITQSFGAGEGSFNNGLAALKQLRKPFEDAVAKHITVFASSGDGGSTNGTKQSLVGHGGGGAGQPSDQVIPYPSVIWPASDPLVTSVGGTYLCTDAVTGLTVDNVSPPATCDDPSVVGDREPAWFDSGGGYSIYFTRGSWQSGPSVDPPGGSYVGSTPNAPGPNTNMRGVPDVAYQASSRTGVLVYLSEPSTSGGAPGGFPCGGVPCSAGWYVVGGTSSSSPQWAGIIAMADQVAGHDLGFISPALYAIANGPNYHADFYDVHNYNNQTSPIPGWPATQGWDAVTGIGTPDVAKLIPDLIAAST